MADDKKTENSGLSGAVPVTVVVSMLATHPQGRRERSNRPHRMAAGKRPRRRTHAHAVERQAQRGIQQEVAVASRAAELPDS